MIDITNEVKDFKKYYIIPKEEIAFIVHSGNAADAMSCFAWAMDSDMNRCFRAVTEEEYIEYKREREAVAAMDGEIEFMASELIEDPDFTYPVDVCYKIAALAYKIYCKAGSYPYCDIETEYDAINRAVEEYRKDG